MLLMKTDDLRGKSTSKSIFETPWDDSLKYWQIATRQQRTKVRSDNVATAQVRHYDPEPRSRVLLSNATSRGGKAIAICVVGDLSRIEAM